MSDVNPALQAAISECRNLIQKGSKSFSLAAALFGKEKQEAASLLYGWCRYCDDQIDLAEKEEGQQALEARLEVLKSQTLAAYEGQTLTHPIFIVFQYVVTKYQIPREYPLELIEGMAMDVRRERYATFHDLKLYCYRVAGVVGLMMSHIMGVSDENALRHAADLGIGMQITNICRDVQEDATLGRLYIPLEWVKEMGMDPKNILDSATRAKLLILIRRMLQGAEGYYRSGDAGLGYLSFRCACAVAAAREIYSTIGDEILKRGEGAIVSRVWLSKPKKLWLLIRGVGRALTTLPQRIRVPWRPIRVQLLWRHG